MATAPSFSLVRRRVDFARGEQIRQPGKACPTVGPVCPTSLMGTISLPRWPTPPPLSRMAAGSRPIRCVEPDVISDEELLQRANGGDPDAFETLYRRYRDWVHRLAWRYTGNEHDALDVLQETFIYLL